MAPNASASASGDGLATGCSATGWTIAADGLSLGLINTA
jgi:hypothetical protein